MPFEKTENEIRHRIQNPDDFLPDTFRRKDISDGISLIIGKKKSGGPMVTQAIRFDKDKFTMEQAKAWVEKHKDSFSEKIKKMEEDCEVEFGCKEKKMSEIKTEDIDNVEVFASGTWNGDTYTEADLDNIVSAFNETKEQIKPYLKIGHNSKQTLLAADELPAAGWVENLRRQGNKLVADFKKVPSKIYELIKNGAYRRVSSEIYWNATIAGKKYPYALKAVALLGATTPAVQTLKDILSAYSDAYGINFASDAEVKAYDMEDNSMVEELKKTIAEKEAALTEATAKVAEFSAKVEELNKTVEAIKAESETLKTEKRYAEIDKKVDALIADKKIAPASKEKLVKLLRAVPDMKAYSEGEKDLSLEEAILAFASDGKVTLSTEEKTSATAGKEDIADIAKKYAEENKVSYKEALKIVSKQEKK